MMNDKILIANRGEIAVRVIRACRELSIPTVAIYSTADKACLHVKLADEAICIGGPLCSESYLNLNNILSAAIATGATMIHPGYGFLSENAFFAEMVTSCGIKFIGPSADTIRLVGDKASAKQVAQSVGVPVILGSEGVVESLEEGLKVAKKIGFPVMLKATGGGGGRGITVIHSIDDFRQAFDRTAHEAETSFGNKNLYVEKYLEAPRHIEIQILADQFGSVLHLGERDCSLQRRNQKMIEESPAPTLSELLRKRIILAALKMARAVKYVNAGTIEFLVDKHQNFYFMEMNTRIQVEHPVTEEVTGIDLIIEQIRIAQGLPLDLKQINVKSSGHAIECRIYAEDPNLNFRPTPGKIQQLILPGGKGVRIDTHIYSGYEVPSIYDSMLAKLIVKAPTRKEAIRKMTVALEQFVIEGLVTTIDFHYLLIHTPEFIDGEYDTEFITRYQNRLKEIPK